MVHRSQRDGWAAPRHPDTVQAGPTGPPTYPRYHRGRMQGAALGNEQAGHCNWRTGGGSSCPLRQDVLDRLSLLLCSRELLGHVTGCVAEEASLGHRNLEELNFVGIRMSTRHSQRWRSFVTLHDQETVP